jgi:hypothetical protein
MSEVGLVRFGQVALDVAQATVPRYRTAFSKHQFTQPQLLAILCLMRYEDWTYRSRGATGGTLRTAPRSPTSFRSRLHDAVPLPAPTGGGGDRSILARGGSSHAAARSARPCRSRYRCQRAGPRRGQHILCTPHVPSNPTTAALAALVEVAGGGRPEAATHPGAVGPSGPVE